MNNKFKITLVLIVFVVPYIIIYKAFFTTNPLAWGDSPYFYPDNLNNLFKIPFLWDFRNTNFGDPQAGILWLYLPTFIVGLLHKLLNFNFEVLIRLIFLLPATILSILGSFKFIGKFSKNFEGRLLGSFLYAFNTYFLMALDGGQIGVGLAYGIFPLVIVAIINYLEVFNKKNFLIAVVAFFAITNVDLRVGIMALLFSFVFYLIKNYKKIRYQKSIFNLLIFCFAVLLLNCFWLIPFVKNSGEFSGNRFTDIQQTNSLISLTNSFFLFQPHFPVNDFGRLFPTPFYFSVVIFLILIINIFFGKKVNLLLSLLFLSLVFLAKGQSYPLGEIYGFVVSNFPLGQAFRDSTKFYIPLFLTASVLLCLSYEILTKNFNKKIIFPVIFVYLIVLIYPAFFGSLGGLLSNKSSDSSFQVIKGHTENEKPFFRSIWFPEAPPLAYSSSLHPAVYANRLYMERPFASLIDGDYDLFNFLNSDKFSDFLALVGGRYTFFPENERKKIWTQKEIDERKIFLDFIDKVPGFKKLNWGLNFAGYENTKPVTPHVFAQSKSFFIIGGDEIYADFFKDKKFNLANNGFVFLESCQISPDQILSYKDSSLDLIFNGKSEIDVQMLNFCDQFKNINTATQKQWAIRTTDQYLRWKSELLQKGVRTYEYDLGKGVAFSTIAGEKLSFVLNVADDRDYFLPVRYMSPSNSGVIEVKVNGNKIQNLQKNSDTKFNWEVLGPFSLKKGNANIEFINRGGLQVLNTFGLIKKDDYEEAVAKTSTLLAKFKSFDISKESDRPNIFNEINNGFIPVKYEEINPTEYSLQIPREANWLVFTDHYHPKWGLDGIEKSLPFYSMINGFYIGQLGSNQEHKMYFTPQSDIRPSIIFSLISFGVLAILIFISTFNNKK